MEFVKLKPRPRSTHTVTNFGGLRRNAEAPAGGLSLSKAKKLYWYDEKNLSSEAAPMMSIAKRQVGPTTLDGNILDAEIVAFCGGEHPVILDVEGNLWCRGNSVNMDCATAVTYHWSFTPDTQGLSVSPESGTTQDAGALGGLLTVGEYTHEIFGEPGPDETAATEEWRIDNKVITNADYTYRQYTGLHGETIDEWVLTDYGITISTDHFDVRDVQVISLDTWGVGYLTGPAPRMVRSGAFVYLIPDKDGNGLSMFANVEKLAAGETMVAGTDYGFLDYKSTHSGSLENPTTIRICDQNGESISNVISGNTEPVSHDSYWLDTSGGGPVLRQWSAATTSWVIIPNTFLKIKPVALTDANGVKLKKGDAVKFTASYFPDFTDPPLEDLLNSSLYLYNVLENENAIVVSGILPDDTYETTAIYTIERKVPKMDYIVECGNRLWGCYYGPGEDGGLLNEIYASKLGDPSNWSVYQGLSTDSWAASRGTAAPFTGAAVLHNSPLFFREESVEKVYPSASGAHQIQKFDLEGVELGSHLSLVVLDDRLYYKGRKGIMVYSGTMPVCISEAFGDLRFTDGTAGVHQRKYVISMLPVGGETRIAAAYDTETGDWHLEDYGWEGAAVSWKDGLYYIEDGYLCRRYGAAAITTQWYAETGLLGVELPEHRYISCIRIRYAFGSNSASAKVFIQFENSSDWIEKASLKARNLINTQEVNIYPRRCDHFRLRLEGIGPIHIVSISYRMERSQGGH